VLIITKCHGILAGPDSPEVLQIPTVCFNNQLCVITILFIHTKKENPASHRNPSGGLIQHTYTATYFKKYKMKMMFKNLLMAASLSTTLAAGTRRVQESTLGELFLATAKNVTGSDPQVSFQRDFSINANFVTGDEMATLASELRESCNDLGYIESESSYSDTSTGELQSMNMYCRLSTGEDFNVALTAMMDSVNAANPASTSTSTSVYSNGYYDAAARKAMLQLMEMLLQMAETIEEVMLIVPYWSNYVADAVAPSSSSININLNKAYVETYSTSAPTMTIDEDTEEDEEVARKKLGDF
jgi:hypothetical protein